MERWSLSAVGRLAIVRWPVADSLSAGVHRFASRSSTTGWRWRIRACCAFGLTPRLPHGSKLRNRVIGPVIHELLVAMGKWRSPHDRACRESGLSLHVWNEIGVRLRVTLRTERVGGADVDPTDRSILDLLEHGAHAVPEKSPARSDSHLVPTYPPWQVVAPGLAVKSARVRGTPGVATSRRVTDRRADASPGVTRCKGGRGHEGSIALALAADEDDRPGLDVTRRGPIEGATGSHSRTGSQSKRRSCDGK